MTATNYAACYAKIRKYEGGNVDDKRDPGGRTSRGVTQRVYDAYRNRKGQRPKDVWSASDDEVGEIYRLQYWDAVKGDELPDGIDLVTFDGSVNSGPKQSIKWLQAALNACRGRREAIIVDGVIGQATLDLAESVTAPDAVISEICNLRMGFLRRLKTWKTFGKGWAARVADVRRSALAMAHAPAASAEPVAPLPDVPRDDGMGNAKALSSDVRQPAIGSGAAISMTGGTATAATVSEVVTSAASNIEPIKDLSRTLTYVFIGLTILGIIIGAYAAYRERQAKHANEATAWAPMPDG